MLDVHQYYPLGYRTLVHDGERTEIKPDSELLSLIAMYRLNPAVSNAWAFKSQVIECAKRLFGSFDSFLKEQETNRKLIPHARQYLLDTIQFIHHGKRDVAHDSWLSIFSAAHASGELNRRNDIPKDAKLVSHLKIPAKDVYWHWLKQRGGFEDMLCTIRLVFGTDFA